MSTNAIGADMIKKLMQQTAKEKITTQQDDKTRWPGTDNMVRLATAVLNDDAPVVVFRNGTRFDIKYKGDSVFIKPSTGFVPSGWFSLHQLREALKTND